MFGHLRIKSPWAQLAIFLGLFGAAFVLSVMVTGVVFVAKGWPLMNPEAIDWTHPEIVSTMKILQGISSILLFLLPAIFYALFTFTRKHFYFLGLKKAEKNYMYWLAALCILLAFPAVGWLGELNQHIPLPKWMTNFEKDASKQMEAFLKVETSADIFFNVILIAFLPAVCEEICFRGALQRILIQLTRNPWIGILLTSVLFSALHLQFQGFLPRMFLGVVLGTLYWYSGSLWPSIIAHFVNNGAQVIAVSYYPQYINENPTIPVYAAILSGAAVFAILRYYQKKSTITYSKVYEVDELTPTNQFLA
jgi:membrane protease YdiL (CAAX protease family)